MAFTPSSASPAQVPLTELVARLVTLVRAMSLDDVASFLGAVVPSAASASPSRPAASGGVEPLDAIARAILALPSGRQRLREVERVVVVHALARTKGNVSAAARLLGTDRKALERRIERHRISVR